MLGLGLGCRDLEVPLPSALQRFGPVATASLTGNPEGPLIAVLGGISGNRFVCSGPTGGPGWWPGMVGRGCAVEPEKHLVLGLDFAADATGRCAPSTKDQAHVLAAVLDQIGRDRFDAIVGASYGGMVALSFAQHFPSRVDKLAIISAGADPHPAATAIRELQRRVVALGLQHGDGAEALSIARGLAMLSYRTPAEFGERFRGGLDCEDPLSSSDAGGYLKARGQAFQAVMSPERFLSLSASIDRHSVDAQRIEAPTLLIGATSDQIVPPCQMEVLARALGAKAELHMRDCLYGHDMFLKEATAVGRLVQAFLER
jgi:homoserine O-acetyltransferase